MHNGYHILQLITNANQLLANLVHEKIIKADVFEKFSTIFRTKWPSIGHVIVEKI